MYDRDGFILALTFVGVVAIVAIFGMFIIHSEYNGVVVEGTVQDGYSKESLVGQAIGFNQRVDNSALFFQLESVADLSSEKVVQTSDNLDMCYRISVRQAFMTCALNDDLSDDCIVDRFNFFFKRCYFEEFN